MKLPVKSPPRPHEDHDSIIHICVVFKGSAWYTEDVQLLLATQYPPPLPAPQCKLLEVTLPEAFTAACPGLTGLRHSGVWATSARIHLYLMCYTHFPTRPAFHQP